MASNGNSLDQFGNAVAISAEFAIVGALMQFSNGKGTAYLFRRDGENWIEQHIITASDANINDRFGNAVGLSENAAIIGARYNDDHGLNSGAAYVIDGFAQTVAIGEQNQGTPQRFALHQNYLQAGEFRQTQKMTLLR